MNAALVEPESQSRPFHGEDDGQGLKWAFNAYSRKTENEIVDNAPIYVNYGRMEDYNELIQEEQIEPQRDHP